MNAKAGALGTIRRALTQEADRFAKTKRIAELIRESGEYRWAGIYDAGSEEIAAIAWTGADAPAFPRFPKSQGLCGAAVCSKETVVVGDVTKDPRYLTTFGSTRSEIVVPISSRTGGKILGLIDVESERRNAFGEADQAFLEECAALLTSLWE